MVARLELQVEVVGCPTVCRHCWAQGVPYPAMPVADIAWGLEQTHRFCDDHRLGFGAYPMHELAAHPQAAEVLRVFADHVGAAEFEPLATTGVPLAIREDWQELLATAASLGTTTVWVAFHGLGGEHDRQVNRPGAFAETCPANVFLTTANAGQAERLLAVLQRLQVDEMPGSRRPTGVAGRYCQRHGNLRSDGAQAVLGRALNQAGRSIDAIWFGRDRLPAVDELAARYGDRNGQALHFTEASIRYLWLDRGGRLDPVHRQRDDLAPLPAPAHS